MATPLGFSRATPDARANPVPPRVEDAPHLALVPPAVTPASFCAELKAAREASGLSLAAIATKSKVGVALFVALERADLSRWPKGIYRRSFFKAYAEAIGLPADTVVQEFLKLFPDEEPVAEVRVPTGGPSAPLRLTFGEMVQSGSGWLRLRRWVGAQLIRWGAALSA